MQLAGHIASILADLYQIVWVTGLSHVQTSDL